MKEPSARLSSEVSESDWEKTPPSIKALVESLLSRLDEMEKQLEVLKEENRELREENRELREENKRLKQENEVLKEQLQRNSNNSSQPPSADKFKGFKATPKSGRKRGGQPGHEGRGQKRYPAEACERLENYYPQECHRCGSGLAGDDPEPQWVQQIELPKLEPVVVEHRFHQLKCESCGALTRGWDEEILNGSVYGERLSALVGWLCSVGHQSHRQVQALFDEVFNIEISTGGINRIRCELSDSLADIAQEAREYVRDSAIVNMDETSFVQGNGDGNNPKKTKGWLWVAVTPLVSYFEVFLSRSKEVARQLLSEDFGGIVGSDRCGAYVWLANEQRQVCWAHLKRDFTQIAERSGVSAQLGAELLKQQQLLFTAWYQVRDGTLSRGDFAHQLKPIREEVRRLLEEGANYDVAKGEKTAFAKTVGTCRKMLTVEPAFWTFALRDGIEPTNNAAERALRPAVLWRKHSFGSNSKAGSRFVARMMTTVTSLKAQKLSTLAFLAQALQASRSGFPRPSLIPAIGTTV